MGLGEKMKIKKKNNKKIEFKKSKFSYLLSLNLVLNSFVSFSHQR